MELKNNKWIFAVVFALSLTFFVVGTVLFCITDWDFLYEYHYKKDETMRYTDATLEDLMSLTDEIQLYMKGELPSFDLTLKQSDGVNHVFTLREQLHMKDVMVLYSRFRDLCFLGGILFFATAMWLYVKNKKNLYLSMKNGIKIIASFFALLLLAVLVNFEAAFTLMHKILFSNDLWLLNNTDMLILLFPENFFMMMGIIILSFIILILVLIYVLSSSLLRRSEREIG